MSYTVSLLSGKMDPRLPDWLDLYQYSFPLREQVSVGCLLREPEGVFQAAEDADGAVCGIGWWEWRQAAGVRVCLGWYWAVAPWARNRGVGALLYRDTVRRATEAGCAVTVGTVDDPDTLTGEEARYARRRISFRERLGDVLVPDARLVGPQNWPDVPDGGVYRIMVRVLVPDMPPISDLLRELFSGQELIL